MAYRLTPLLGNTGMGVFPLVAAAGSTIVSAVGKAQEAQRRATKLQSNIDTAQARNSLADQSYLQYAARTGATRYEYDQLVAPLVRSGTDHAAMDVLRNSGLFTEAYIRSLSWAPDAAIAESLRSPLFQSDNVTRITPVGPAGSSPVNPTGSTPGWMLPAAIVAGLGLLAISSHH